MDASRTLYLIRDRRGRVIAYPTREEADLNQVEGSPQPGVEVTSFHTLAKDQPRALVYIYSQYYWAEDLT